MRQLEPLRGHALQELVVLVDHLHEHAVATGR
jgi:hypothetical protein